jgi:drug/metabolite transporter (DMT)-like permease
MTHDERRGLWLGFVGVAIFALTLPMTRLAVGTPQAPLMSGVFVAMGRAAVAGLLSALLLAATQAPRPRVAHWPLLAASSAGVVFGFPLFTSVAMRYVEAVHASVILGVLPLATAIAGALLHRQRPSTGFWTCAAVGALLVAGYAVMHAGQGLRPQRADLLLFAATASAAVGYACGGRLSQAMPAEHVICWSLVAALPLTVPLALWTHPTATLPATAWAGFGYVALFSQWIGFFAWYRGLAIGGTVRVSQVQLVQPFLSMLFAVPLLGERLDLLTMCFGLAVIATVFLGKKMPVRAATASEPPRPAHLGGDRTEV